MNEPKWLDDVLDLASHVYESTGRRLVGVTLSQDYYQPGMSVMTATGAVKVSYEIPKPREQLRSCECVKCPVCSGHIPK